MGTFSSWHWIIIVFITIFLCFRFEILHPKLIYSLKKLFTDLLSVENDFSNKELKARLLGICGLVFLITLIFNLTNLYGSPPISQEINFGYIIGSALAPVFVGFIFSGVYFLICMSFGKQIYKKNIFHLVLVGSSLTIVLAVIGGLSR